MTKPELIPVPLLRLWLVAEATSNRKEKERRLDNSKAASFKLIIFSFCLAINCFFLSKSLALTTLLTNQGTLIWDSNKNKDDIMLIKGLFFFSYPSKSFDLIDRCNFWNIL